MEKYLLFSGSERNEAYETGPPPKFEVEKRRFCLAEEAGVMDGHWRLMTAKWVI